MAPRTRDEETEWFGEGGSRTVALQGSSTASPCGCGCGETTLMDRNGIPNRFVYRHGMRGAKSPNWRGGVVRMKSGYRRIYLPGHSRAIGRGYVFEHTVIAEVALGRDLPPGAVVHHVNEVRDDNRNSNLVICEGRGYHNVLHRRMRARAAGCDPNWRRCVFCKKYDDPARMYIPPTQRSGHHRECRERHKAKRRAMGAS